MNEQQRRFADAILQGKNQTDAYIEAGYVDSDGTKVNASKLIRHPEVAEYLAQRREEISKEVNLSAKRVIEELKKIAFSDIGSVLHWEAGQIQLEDLANLPPEVTAAISSLGEKPTKEGKALELKMHNKIQALKELAKYLGLFEKGSNEGDSFNEWLEQLKDAEEKYGP